jgi:hypothetical protein
MTPTAWGVTDAPPNERPAGPTEPVEPETNARILELLPSSLALLIAALGTVGGLTGGISRVFRNNPALGLVCLLFAIVAILLAVLPRVAHHHRWVTPSLVTFSLLSFVLATGLGLYLAVDTAQETDRPNLSANLVETPSGQWILEGSASASGLAADGSMQVYIYAIPEDRDQPRSQLFFVTAGPGSDGVARQTFSVPLPGDRAYDSFVVTAALGDEVRYCNGTALNVSAGLRTETLADTDIRRNACLAVNPPPGLGG